MIWNVNPRCENTYCPLASFTSTTSGLSAISSNSRIHRVWPLITEKENNGHSFNRPHRSLWNKIYLDFKWVVSNCCLKAGGEGDNRGWDGWMASLTQWTWVWGNSRSWWWTGRPGVLQSMGLQSVRHDWVTELNCCWWASPGVQLVPAAGHSRQCVCHQPISTFLLSGHCGAHLSFLGAV